MMHTTTKNSQGYILLQGGAEFKGQMAISDRRAIELAGGYQVQIDIIPAAAAPDNNHLQAGENGASWFKQLGAQRVVSRPLIDNTTAQDTDLADDLGTSQFIYLLGGFPGHLAAALHHSRCFAKMLDAWKNGAVLGGSSAGAMVLAEYFYDPVEKMIKPGLGLLANICIIPHFQKFGGTWTNTIQHHLPHLQIVGIDEETGIINDAMTGGWTVYGKGQVYLCDRDTSVFPTGSEISYTNLPQPVSLFADSNTE
jgi:cyanophycinase